MGVLEIVIVNTLLANADEVGAAVPDGDVNLQTGALGQPNPVNVVRIFPDALIVDAAENEMVTVTPLAPAV